MKSLKSQNFYEVLGVPRHATAEEIRTAFEISRHTFQENSLATYSLFTDQENQEILTVIAKAYETLFNPESRRAYDAQLDRGDTEPRPARERRPVPAPPPATRRPPDESEPRYMASVTVPAAVPAAQAIFHTVQGAGAASQPELAIPPQRPVPPAPKREPNPQAEEFAKALTTFDGPSLKRLRTLQGISLEDLSERTKIRRAYLEYLEEEQHQFLPAAVYVKGFVSIVAGILGLPAQRAAEDYMSRFHGRTG